MYGIIHDNTPFTLRHLKNLTRIFILPKEIANVRARILYHYNIFPKKIDSIQSSLTIKARMIAKLKNDLNYHLSL